MLFLESFFPKTGSISPSYMQTTNEVRLAVFQEYWGPLKILKKNIREERQALEEFDKQCYLDIELHVYIKTTSLVNTYVN